MNLWRRTLGSNSQMRPSGDFARATDAFHWRGGGPELYLESHGPDGLLWLIYGLLSGTVAFQVLCREVRTES